MIKRFTEDVGNILFIVCVVLPLLCTGMFRDFVEDLLDKQRNTRETVTAALVWIIILPARLLWQLVGEREPDE